MEGNFERGLFSHEVPDPFTSVRFEGSHTLIITPEVKNANKVKVFLRTAENPVLQKQHSRRLQAPVTREYFAGITADTGIRTAQIELLTIRWFFGDNIMLIRPRKVAPVRQIRGHHQHWDGINPVTGYRNPEFVKTGDERSKIRPDMSVLEEVSALTVLDLVDESTKANFGVGSYGQLDRFVVETILPYTIRWHERTFKIVENLRAARSTLSLVCNSTRGLMQGFNSSIDAARFKTFDVVSELVALVVDQGENGYGSSAKMVDRSDRIVRWLHIAALSEIVMLWLFFLCI
jgi:hypothetical protein